MHFAHPGFCDWAEHHMEFEDWLLGAHQGLQSSLSHAPCVTDGLAEHNQSSCESMMPEVLQGTLGNLEN